MDSRPSLKLSHVGSKTKSLGQIVGKSCEHPGGHIFVDLPGKLSEY